jgi:RNAse (barnase) inhibitor barstar
MKTYIINGNDFSTLEGFFEIVSAILVPTSTWGHNLDAFDDILGGGFGTPEEGFVLEWKNSGVSRDKLGFNETVRQLLLRIDRCHPSIRELIERQLQDARSAKGLTVFDWIVEIVLHHGPNGKQPSSNVILRLE